MARPPAPTCTPAQFATQARAHEWLAEEEKKAAAERSSAESSTGEGKSKGKQPMTNQTEDATPTTARAHGFKWLADREGAHQGTSAEASAHPAEEHHAEVEGQRSPRRRRTIQKARGDQGGQATAATTDAITRAEAASLMRI